MGVQLLLLLLLLLLPLLTCAARLSFALSRAIFSHTQDNLMLTQPGRMYQGGAGVLKITDFGTSCFCEGDTNACMRSPCISHVTDMRG